MRAVTLVALVLGVVLVAGCEKKQTRSDVPNLDLRDLETAEAPPEKAKIIETTAVRPLPPPPTPSGTQSYTVQKADTLYKLARQFYGDQSKWKVIYEANRDKIQDPNVLKVGLVLVIPPR